VKEETESTKENEEEEKNKKKDIRFNFFAGFRFSVEETMVLNNKTYTCQNMLTISMKYMKL
jgi:hypothetical protein